MDAKEKEFASMKNRILFTRTSRLVLWLLLVIALSGIGHAASVRGRVERVDFNGRRGVPGIAVTISRPGKGRSSPAYTDSRGMYYLQNIPPGVYNLEIWTAKNPRAPIVYRIQVREPYTDIPPVSM